MADIRIIPSLGEINITGSAEFRGTSGTSLLYLSGSGLIGAGTTTPQSEFHVVSSGTRFFTLDRSGTRSWDLGVNSSGTFLVTDNTEAADRLVINHSGSVGIGTTQPSDKLHVQEGDIRVDDPNNGTVRGLYIRHSGITGNVTSLVQDTSGAPRAALRSTERSIWIQAGSAGNAGGSDIRLYANQTLGLMVSSSGNVGIKNTAPAYPLDVTGTGRISGELRVGANINAYQSDASIWVLNVGQAFTVKQNTGVVQLNSYGSGTNTGTPAYRLSVDSSGNIIEESLGAGAVDGLGSGRYIARWEDTDTLTSSSLYEDANGNIGVGTTGPSYKLDVVGGDFRIMNSAGPTLNFSDNVDQNWDMGVDATTNDFYIKNGISGVRHVTVEDGGNVGIGSTAPEGKLNVVGSTDVLIVEGSGSTSNTTIMAVDGNNGRLFEVSDDLSDSLFSVNTIAGLPVMEAFADNVVTLGAYNQYDLHITGSKAGIGTSTPNVKLTIKDTQDSSLDSGIGIIRSASSQTGYINMVGGAFNFNAPTGIPIKFRDGGTPNMTILGDGNVGIGTESPSSTLHLSAASPYIFLDDTSTSGTRPRAEIKNGDVGVIQSLLFGFNNTSGTNLIEVLVVNESGKVGVGTTAPSEKLTVQGNISASGLVYVPNIGTGTDDSVVILDSDGTLRTDEIDSRVWGSNLVDGSGNSNYMTKWSDSNTITNSQITDDGTTVTYLNSAGTLFRHGLYGSLGQRYSNWDTWIGTNTGVAQNSTSAVTLLTNYSASGASTLNVGFQDLNYYQWTESDLSAYGGATSVLTLPTPSFKVATDGNVGIKTASPSYQLDVSGSVRASTFLTVRGDSNATITDYNQPSTTSVNLGTYINQYAFIDLASSNDNGSWIDFSKADGGDYAGRIRYENVTNEFQHFANGNLTLTIKRDGGATSSWGHPKISLSNSWGGGSNYYPTIGSHDGNVGSLIMFHNPHIIWRTENAQSGYSGRAGLRAAYNSSGNYWDFGLAGDFFHIYRAGTGEFFRVDNAGNVGIGITTPNQKLVVAGNMAVSASNTEGAIWLGNSASGIGLYRDNTYDLVLSQPDASAFPLYLAGAGNVVVSIDANNNETDRKFIVGNNAVKSSNELFSVNESGNVYISNDLTVDGIITAKEFHTTFVSASIIYQSGSTQFGDSADDLHIFSGSIGVNIADPVRTLVLNKFNSEGEGGYLRLQNEVGGSGANVGIDFATFSPQYYSGTVTSTDPVAQIKAVDTGNYAGRLDLLVRGTGTGGTLAEVMTLNNNRNVGIGITSPIKKLQVSTNASGDGGNLLLTNIHDTDGDTASILFSMTDTNFYNKAGIYFERTTTQGRGSLHFATNDQVGSDNVTKADARLSITRNGKVGIGITDPGAILDVNHPDGTTNIIRASSGSGNYRFRVDQYFDLYMTNAGGIDKLAIKNDGTIYAPNIGTDTDNSVVVLNSSGYFKTDEIDSRVWGSSLVDGSGTANRVAYWTDSNSLSADDDFFFDGTSVGIGLTNPTYKLEVRIPDSGNTSKQNVQQWGHTNQNTLQLNMYGGATDLVQFAAINAEQNIAIVTEASANLSATTTKGIYIKSGGSVGVGTTAPGAKLEIYGTGNTLRLDSAANGAKELLFRNVGTQTATIKTDGDLKLYVEDAGKNILFDTTGGEKMRIQADGNVGIGTTTPADKLEVSGNVRITNNSPILYFYDTDVTDLRHRILGGGNAGLEYSADIGNVATGYHRWDISNSEKMRLVEGGNLGIGTSSPEGELDINNGTADAQVDWSGGTLPYGTEKADLILTRRHSVNKQTGGLGFAGAAIDFRATNSSNEWSTAQIVSVIDPTGGGNHSGGLVFLTSGGGTTDAAGRRTQGAAPAARLVIGHNGNVGIGLTNPSNTLEVLGGVTATSFTGSLQGNITGTAASETLDTVSDRGSTTNQTLTARSFVANNASTTDVGLRIQRYTSSGRAQITLEDESNSEIWRIGATGGGTTNFSFFDQTQNALTLEQNGHILMTPGGNVGIGTISPASKLQVDHGTTSEYVSSFRNTTDNLQLKIGTTTGALLNIQGATINTNAAYNIALQAEGGNLGIGITAPGAKLDVNSGISTSSTDVIKLTQATNGADKAAASLGLSIQNGGETTNAADLWFTTANGGSLVERMRITSGGTLRLNSYGAGNGTGTPAYHLAVNSSGYVIESNSFTGSLQGNITGTAASETLDTVSDRGSTTNQVLTAGGFKTQGDIGVTQADGDFLAKLYQSSADGFMELFTGEATPVSRVKISSYGNSYINPAASGNVGIGTSSPTGKLHVDSGLAHNTVKFTTDSSGGTGYDVNVYINGGANNSEMALNMGIIGNEDRDRIKTYQGNMYFRTNDSENMIINSSGNVGINTTAPTAKLNVVGGADVLIVEGSGSTANTTIMAVDGNNGRLFEVSDDLSDSLFSVNTIAGLPVMEAFADNTVVLGAYNQCDLVVTGSKVGIGTCSPSAKLHVSGSSNVLAKFHTNYALSTGFADVFEILDSGMTGGGLSFNIGQSNSTKNLGKLVFNYVGNNSDSNYLGLGFYDADNILNVTAGSRVGIGVTNPVAPFHVKTTAAVDNVGMAVLENDYASGGVYFPALSAINTRGNHSYGIVGEFKTDTSGDSDRPSILFYGAQAAHSWQIGQTTSATGWGAHNNFGIGYRASNDPGTFNTWPTNYFTITTGGDVGIGTTSPSYKLHVDNDAANTNNPALYVRNPNSSTAAVIAEFVGDSDSVQIKNIGVGDYTIYNTQQSNGIALYDGVGGVEIHYAGSTVLEADSNGGIKVTGQLSATADVIAYSSDERLKENIKPIENAVDKVKQMRGVTFDWNKKSEELGFEPTTKLNDVGVIAQEVEKVFPQLIAHAPFDIDSDEEGNTISKSGEDYKTVNYSRLTAVLIEAIKEQQLQIEELREEIKKLKG